MNIHDGFTREGHVAAIERLHPAVSFRYRPTTLEERLDYGDQVQSMRGKDRAVAIAKNVAKKLISWTLGKPITQVALLDPGNVEPNLLLRINNIILGMDVGDAEPDKEADDSVPHEAQERGITPGAVQEERDVKNS